MANYMYGQYGAPGQNLVTIRAPGGVPFTVNRAAAPHFVGFFNELGALGYQFDPSQSGGYSNRNIRGSNRKSQHAFGNAVDINWNQNPFRTRQTNLPDNVAQLAADYGLEWGGNWRRPDPMHFEWTGRKGKEPMAYMQYPYDPFSPLPGLGEAEARPAGPSATGGGLISAPQRPATTNPWDDRISRQIEHMMNQGQQGKRGGGLLGAILSYASPGGARAAQALGLANNRVDPWTQQNRMLELMLKARELESGTKTPVVNFNGVPYWDLGNDQYVPVQGAPQKFTGDILWDSQGNPYGRTESGNILPYNTPGMTPGTVPDNTPGMTPGTVPITQDIPHLLPTNPLSAEEQRAQEKHDAEMQKIERELKAEQQRLDEIAASNVAEKSRMLEDVNRALDLSGFWTTGFMSKWTKNFEGSPAYNLGELITGLESNISRETLQEMRNRSKTGGALGNVSDRDIALLAARYGVLKQSQGKKQFDYNLRRFREDLLDIVHGKGNRPPGSYTVGLPKEKKSTPKPKGFPAEQEVWDLLDDEQKKLWQN